MNTQQEIISWKTSSDKNKKLDHIIKGHFDIFLKPEKLSSRIGQTVKPVPVPVPVLRSRAQI